MIAQNDWDSEYIDIRYVGFFLGSDSYESDSDSNSNSNSDSGWLRYNLWLCLMVAQNDKACYYITIRYAGFFLDSYSSYSDSYSNSDTDRYSDSDRDSSWLWLNL